MSTTNPYPSAPDLTVTPAAGKPGDASIGELMSRISADVSMLMRQELALAKAELREEAGKAGKGAGLLGAAGYAGHMVLLFGTFALTFAIGRATGIGWACFIVTVIWAATAAALAFGGRRALGSVHPKPERTIQTLKEDAQWARHPRR